MWGELVDEGVVEMGCVFEAGAGTGDAGV